MAEKFFVHRFYLGETYISDEKSYDAEGAVKRARELSIQKQDERGKFEEIRITDQDDCIVFSWSAELGVVFPPKP